MSESKIQINDDQRLAVDLALTNVDAAVGALHSTREAQAVRYAQEDLTRVMRHVAEKETGKLPEGAILRLTPDREFVTVQVREEVPSVEPDQG